MARKILIFSTAYHPFVGGAEVAVKEVLEETGVEVEPKSLIAVFDGLRLGFARLPLYSAP